MIKLEQYVIVRLCCGVRAKKDVEHDETVEYV